MGSNSRFQFQLYIAGGAQNSVQAMANLSALCKAHLPNRHKINVVDVYKEPKRALADRVFLTPTLVKLWPLPVLRIVGTLSQTQLVVQALDLPSTP